MVIMAHLDPTHIPFALSMLPFLGLGIALPATLQDWFYGRLTRGDGISLVVGLVIVGLWQWAILRSVDYKRRKGESRLIGRELSSWLWAPPLAFVAGIGCGFIVMNS